MASRPSFLGSPVSVGSGLALAMLVAACAGQIQSFATRPAPVDAGAAVALVSAYRQAHGLGAVRSDARLMRAAQAQATAMAAAGAVSHTVAGRLPGRVEAAGYRWNAVSENLGGGYETLQAAMLGWRQSAGHERNLRSPYATEIGIAAADAEGGRFRRYWALILAAPRDGEGASR